MVLPHFRETPLVRLALPPLLQQWIDDNRKIETDQKSPHGVSFWRTVAFCNGPTILGGEGGTRLWKHEPAGAHTAHLGRAVQTCRITNSDRSWICRVSAADLKSLHRKRGNEPRELQIEKRH